MYTYIYIIKQRPSYPTRYKTASMEPHPVQNKVHRTPYMYI